MSIGCVAPPEGGTIGGVAPPGGGTIAGAVLVLVQSQRLPDEGVEHCDH